MRIKITADSTSDIPQALCREWGIDLLPLYVVRDGQALKDGLEITPDDIYAHVSAGGDMVSTAAVSVADYLGYFQPILEEYDAIVHINIGANFSACHQNCLLAAEELPGKVFPVDSRSLSTGSGLLALEAAALAREGKDPEEIVAAVNARRDKVDISFVLETLTYLYKGGRCSGVAALGANLLHLRPCIEVVRGAMGVGKKYRGPMQKCWEQYVKDRLADKDSVDPARLFITDSGIAPGAAEAIRDMALAQVPFREVYFTRAGCTISSHCGPNTMGIIFFRK
jgi:DegV family protein with EDD domain